MSRPSGSREPQNTPKYIGPQALLEVVHPAGGVRPICVTKSPFLIGRGPESDLLLVDIDISRSCAKIAFINGRFHLEDLGNKSGVFVNGEQIHSHRLRDGDTISFGVVDSYTLIFRRGPVRKPLEDLVGRFEQGPELEPRTHALRQLGLLLEATALLQSQLPMEDILVAVVDRAIEMAGAQRGILFQSQEGQLEPLIARERGARPVSADSIHLSEFMEFYIRQAIEDRKSILHGSTGAETAREVGYTEGGGHLRLGLLWACLPLWSTPQMRSLRAPDGGDLQDLLGVLYLDSPYRGDFKRLYTQSIVGTRMLDTLAAQASSVLANARLVEEEQKRRRMEQELAIAREIQQALLPKGFKNFAHVEVAGMNRASLLVGGDYFDLMELDAERIGFVIADISGKGLGAALLATMLQGTLSAIPLASDAASVLDHANRFVCEHCKGQRFATVFFGTLVADGGLHYINAGHMPPLLVRSGSVQRAFHAESVPLGLFSSTNFVTQWNKLEPGDTLVLLHRRRHRSHEPSGKRVRDRAAAGNGVAVLTFFCPRAASSHPRRT